METLKTEWTDRVWPDEVAEHIAGRIGLDNDIYPEENKSLENALYWLKTMAENKYNYDLRVLWNALQIMTERGE